MAFSEKAKDYAFERISRRREAAADKADAASLALYERFPELREYDRKISSLGASLSKAAARGEIPIESVHVQIGEASKKRAAFLKKQGVPSGKSFAFCKNCDDTGYRDGHFCECAKILMREYSAAEINRSFPLALSGFGNFSLEYYSKNPGDGFGGLSPRENMENVLACCAAYAAGLPGGESLLMMGDAGLGKTHLALSIAKDAVNRGHGVIYCGAADIFKTVETEYYQNGHSAETLNALKQCELLILDDLGAEYINPFTASAIYTLVNTRAAASRPTVYTTNITKQETLEARYGEKTASRLIGCCRLLSFFGDDVRLMKK